MRVLDAELEEERDLTPQSIVGRLEAGAGAEVILGASLRRREGDVRHRDGVDDRRSDVARPATGSVAILADEGTGIVASGGRGGYRILRISLAESGGAT
jgi:hypothetical protein